MDPVKKRTLDLIEENVHRLGIVEAGRALLLVAEDYAKDGDLAEAARVIRKIDKRFFVLVTKLVVEDEALRLAVATLIEEMGIDWPVLAEPPKGEA